MGKIKQYDEVETNRLIPYVNNAKQHNENQITKIAASIREFGFLSPCVIDSNYNVIAGHGRIMAAKKLGLKTVPVVFAEGLTDAQRKAYILADNRLGELADWDMDLVTSELEMLLENDFDLDLTWFELPEEPEETEIEEDEIPEEVETRCKPGDLWQMGRHRLICGDSADVAVIDRLMDGVKTKLLLTDPPYGIKADKGFSGADGFNGNGKPIGRRHYKDEWDSERPEKDVFDYICLMAENAVIFGGNFFTDELPVGKHWLVWNKHNTMPTFSDAELAWTNIKRNSVKIYDVEWNGLIGKEKERFHPTQKPVKLFAGILNDYTEKDDTICDFFGGSGSILIACEQLNRKCYMCELDAHYCDVTLQRWENLTGQKAVLLNE